MLNRLTLILSLLSVATCLAGMILAHNEVITAMHGALIFAASGIIGLAAVLSGVLVLITSRNYPIAMVGVLGFMPLIAVVTALAGVYQHPRITDISTDTADAPAFVNAQKIPANAGHDLAFPPANAEPIRLHYPRIQPLALNLSAQQAYERAIEVAQLQKGWELTRKDDAALSFEAVATSKLFHWHDDVVIRVRAEGAGARVDMRSRSREGSSDLGGNARRIEQYFKDLSRYDVEKAK